MSKGIHDHVDDPRNAEILININGELFPRAEAKISVFDSGFILGDGVWEGLRLHGGKLAFIGQHMKRLYEGAKALDMDIGLSPDELIARIYQTCEANGMNSDVHIRLMISRGVKATPYQDPRVTITPPTIVIIPEYKSPLPETLNKGIRLFTVHVRRGYPDVQDPKLNTHSKLNCIFACIQASKAGADEGLMLDPHGFVATCNSTHFFIVRSGEVWTSTGDYCLAGITRGNVVRICRDNGIPVFEKNFSLTDVYGADESFVTGMFAGVAPVTEVEGRVIGEGKKAPIGAEVYFQKHMTLHMLPKMDLGWAKLLRHYFLIRDPLFVVNSYVNQRPQLNSDDIGVKRQLSLFQELRELTGQPIPILDAKDVLSQPRLMMEKLCTRLEIPFCEEMLHWPAGPRESDSCWAKHWYHAVEASTGFAPFKAPVIEVTPEQRAVAEDSRAAYLELYRQRLKIDP